MPGAANELFTKRAVENGNDPFTVMSLAFRRHWVMAAPSRPRHVWMAPLLQEFFWA